MRMTGGPNGACVMLISQCHMCVVSRHWAEPNAAAMWLQWPGAPTLPPFDAATGGRRLRPSFPSTAGGEGEEANPRNIGALQKCLAP